MILWKRTSVSHFQLPICEHIGRRNRKMEATICSPGSDESTCTPLHMTSHCQHRLLWLGQFMSSPHVYPLLFLSLSSELHVCLVAQSCPILCEPVDCSPPGSSVHGKSPGKNTGVGCHAFLQRTFPTQGLNPGLPHCRWFLYHLNHQGSPWILEWVAYPFSRTSSQLRN